MCSKKVLKPVQRRHAAHHLIDAYRISARRACRVLNLQRASFA
jgi:putative transposase